MCPPVVNCILSLNVSRHSLMNGTEHHSEAVGLLIIPVNINFGGRDQCRHGRWRSQTGADAGGSAGRPAQRQTRTYIF